MEQKTNILKLLPFCFLNKDFKSLNKNTNKSISVTAKCSISLNFLALLQLAERREVQNNVSCFILYHI